MSSDFEARALWVFSGYDFKLKAYRLELIAFFSGVHQ
jgi:hypothetical protein